MQILIPILIFAVMGAVAGILLTVASKVFSVEIDPRKEQITEALPGANCGGCGYAGCADYANAVVEGKAEPNLCKPGGAETTAKIGAILGTSVEAAEPTVMTLHCNGNCNATKAFYDYQGTPTCAAANTYFGGDGLCSFGCLGYGDCMAVCDEGAIYIEDGIAHIIEDKCGSCGKCAKACPNGLLSLKPKRNGITVACSSKDNAKNTKINCINGCIGCKMCEKKCPKKAISVQDFHAVIDYELCTGCGLCANICPQKCIHNRPKPQKQKVVLKPTPAPKAETAPGETTEPMPTEKVVVATKATAEKKAEPKTGTSSKKMQATATVKNATVIESEKQGNAETKQTADSTASHPIVTEIPVKTEVTKDPQEKPKKKPTAVEKTEPKTEASSKKMQATATVKNATVVESEKQGNTETKQTADSTASQPIATEIPVKTEVTKDPQKKPAVKIPTAPEEEDDDIIAISWISSDNGEEKK